MAIRKRITLGTRFGELVVLRFERNEKDGRPAVVCICDCGSEKAYRATQLSSGSAITCRGPRHPNPLLKHGFAGSKIYGVWRAMRERCNDPKNNSYPRYGGRGIRVCDSWNESFESFLTDMGIPAQGLTLERSDVNGNYEKSNCCWATMTQQARNTRSNRIIEFNGKSQSLAAWADELRLDYKRLHGRLAIGYSFADAIAPGNFVTGPKPRNSPPI